MIEEVGKIQKLTVGGGLIVFVQSYGYQKLFKEFIDKDNNQTEESKEVRLLQQTNTVFWES